MSLLSIYHTSTVHPNDADKKVDGYKKKLLINDARWKVCLSTEKLDS